MVGSDKVLPERPPIDLWPAHQSGRVAKWAQVFKKNSTILKPTCPPSGQKIRKDDRAEYNFDLCPVL